jgi:pyroglutamyl-peptidase
MRSVLITGFEPFDEHPMNPSQSIAEQLDGQIIANARIIGLTLPVVFGQDTKLMFSAIEELSPAVILSFGLTAEASTINIEMFAINHRNVDDDHTLGPIIPGAPAAYFATIDVDRVGKAIGKRANVPVCRHGYAGSYLCNHIFYQTLHRVSTNSLQSRIGFLHIPFAEEQTKQAPDRFSLPLDQMVEAARIAVEEALGDES